MKTFYTYLTAFAIVVSAATGCVDETPPYANQPTPQPTQQTGYLVADNPSITVIDDTQTDTQTDDLIIKPQQATRTSPATDDFLVEISDADGAQVLATTFGDLKARLASAPLELPAGVYRLDVRSEATMPAAGWEHPYYAAVQDFVIERTQNTSLGTIVCTLQNIKVTVAYTATLTVKLAETTTTTVALGDNSLVFAKDETRAAYFQPTAETNTLNFDCEGVYSDTGEAFSLTERIDGILAGQWRKIAVDKAVNPPTIVWPGYDLSQVYWLDDVENIRIDITAEAGIRSFVITIISDDLAPLLALVAPDLTEPFDLCTVSGDSADFLTELGFPLGADVQDKTELTFDITQFIALLKIVPPAATNPTSVTNFTFRLDITDNDGNTSTAAIQLKYDTSAQS